MPCGTAGLSCSRHTECCLSQNLTVPGIYTSAKAVFQLNVHHCAAYIVFGVIYRNSFRDSTGILSASCIITKNEKAKAGLLLVMEHETKTECL